MKRRTLRERAELERRADNAMERLHKKFVKLHGGESEFTNGYTWGAMDGWFAGYRSAKREQRRGK